MKPEISEILFQLEQGVPLSPIASLRAVEKMDWNRVQISEQSELCDLILRVSADLIVHRFTKQSKNYNEYEDVFRNIKDCILSSDLPKRLGEFGRYFEKYCSYLDIDQ